MNSAQTEPAATPTEREEIRSILAARIRAIDERLEDIDAEAGMDEEVQIRWTRTLGYLSGQYRKLLKDTDINEMEEDLELLKEARDMLTQQ